LTQRVLADAQRNGAEAIIVACPMCHANLDMRQNDIRNLSGIDFNLPIIYLSELIGLALGLSATEVAINKHLTEVTGFLQKVK
ncbi:MAG: disulfide reductase, partial [Candidatus Sumerlaeia bacterium]|nr:disulfide reductase [Candidatus Sumerlaeia bacterium]